MGSSAELPDNDNNNLLLRNTRMRY
jgi:hypothetical protein